jgi:hypothetical protein
MTTEAGPTTGQGRWLIEHQGLVNISKPAHHSMRGDEIDLRASVVTIEGEAIAAERARIRAAVEGLPRFAWLGSQVGDGSFLQRAAVLAIIEPEP